MPHYDKDARQILREMHDGKTVAEYVDVIWASRYPKPAPRSSNGWPFKRLGETPSKTLRVVT